MFKPVVICLALIGAAGQGVAQTNVALGGLAVDTAATIEATADSLSVDQDSGRAIFDGNVLIVQGELRLGADRVEVVYGETTAEIARLLASGGVTVVTAEDAAEAQSADYNIETGLLTLTGDVLLTQGASAISAGEMVINVTDGTARMSGRVRTLLNQGEN